MISLEETELLNEKTSVNSSDLVVNATHQSLEDGKQGRQLKTEGKTFDILQHGGLPSTASQSGGNPKAKTPNAQAKLEDEVRQTYDVSSGKKTNGPTYKGLNVAQRNTIARHGPGIKVKHIIAAAVVFCACIGVVDAFIGPMDRVAKCGERVVLPCVTDTGHPVKWFQNGKLLHTGYEFENEFKDLYAVPEGPKGCHDLIINSADENMAGDYTCQQVGDVKNVTARLTVLDVNCSIVKTNITTVVCKAVITGSKVTRSLWEVIHEGRVTNATGTVTLANSDIVDGIQRQNITSALILSEDFLRINGSCRLILEFSPAITIRRGEEVANNIPTYTVEVPFSTNDTFVAEALPVRKEPDFRRTSMELWLNIFLIFVLAAFGLFVTLVPILCNFSNQWTDVNPAAFF